MILTIPCLPRQQPLRLNIVCHLSRHSFLIQCSYNPPNSLFVSHVNPLNDFLCPMSTTSNQLDIVCHSPPIQSSQDPLWIVPPPVLHLYNARLMFKTFPFEPFSNSDPFLHSQHFEFVFPARFPWAARVCSDPPLLCAHSQSHKTKKGNC